jgi:hypothetical protein
MYRQYFKNTLNTNDLKVKNHYAPEGLRFCNGICLDYRDLNDFSGKQKKMICDTCRNKLGLAQKNVKNGDFTAEQFAENPGILEGFAVEIETYEICKTCKQNKKITEFSKGKRSCKSCRAISSRERNMNIEKELKEIENNKRNLKILDIILCRIPKGRLAYIISHYQIGRSASDTKSDMVKNILNHFKTRQNPNLCLGGCSKTLNEKYSTCHDCKQLKQRKINSRRLDQQQFDEKLDEIVQNLTHLDNTNEYMYNTVQIYKIGIKLGVNVKQKMNKAQRVKLINDFLQKRQSENKQMVNNIEIKEQKPQQLQLNNLIIEDIIMDAPNLETFRRIFSSILILRKKGVY